MSPSIDSENIGEGGANPNTLKVTPEMYDQGRLPLAFRKILEKKSFDLTYNGLLVRRLGHDQLDVRGVNKALFRFSKIRPRVELTFLSSGVSGGTSVLAITDAVTEKAVCKSIKTLMLFDRFIRKENVTSLGAMTTELWTKLVTEHLSHNYMFEKIEGTPFYTADGQPTERPRRIIEALTSGEEKLEPIKHPLKQFWMMRDAIPKEILRKLEATLHPCADKVVFFAIEYDCEHSDYCMNGIFSTRYDYALFDVEYLSDGELIVSQRTPKSFTKELMKQTKMFRVGTTYDDDELNPPAFPARIVEIKN